MSLKCKFIGCVGGILSAGCVIMSDVYRYRIQAITNFYPSIGEKKCLVRYRYIYIYYRFGNFRVFEFSQISDFGTFHEV